MIDLTETQRGTLAGLRREYLTNMRLDDGMDEGTQYAIEEVLRAFGLALTCGHTWTETEYGDLQCTECALVRGR